MVTKALSVGFSFSMRASTAFITSTGETFRRRMAAAISEAGIQQSPSEAMGASFPPGASGAPQSWIERVAKSIAEEIRAEDGQTDGDTREEHEMRRLLRVLRRRDRENATPRRVRLGDAQSQEGQGRLREDRAAELRGGEPDERADGIGQDVAESDPEMRDAESAGGFHVLELADAEHACADDARGPRHDGDRDGQDHVLDGRAEGGGHDEGEHEEGQGLEGIPEGRE